MDLWYWEYLIDYYNEKDQITEERQGILAAKDLTEAMELLCAYYGNTEIENIKTLHTIADMVIDFKDTKETYNFEVSCEGV